MARLLMMATITFIAIGVCAQERNLRRPDAQHPNPNRSPNSNNAPRAPKPNQGSNRPPRAPKPNQGSNTASRSSSERSNSASRSNLRSNMAPRPTPGTSELIGQLVPTHLPSLKPSVIPSMMPSTSLMPSSIPSGDPSSSPTSQPSLSMNPSIAPSKIPSLRPSPNPFAKPSFSTAPSTVPSMTPTTKPTFIPSVQPSSVPTPQLSSAPSLKPSSNPSTSLFPSASMEPTFSPSSKPSPNPSEKPTTVPSLNPTLTAKPTLSPTGTSKSVKQVGVLEAEGRELFGWDLSLNRNGNLLAVGAAAYDSKRGIVRLFEYKEGALSLVNEYIGTDNSRAGTIHAVELSGDGKTLVYGAPHANQGVGFAKIVNIDSNDGNQIDGKTESAVFGRRVSISEDGKLIAVAGRLNDAGTRTYALQDGVWNQIGNTFAECTENVLSGNGEVLALTCYGKGVKIFKWIVDDNQWVQIGTSLTGRRDFGRDLDLSHDGRRVIIGSTDNYAEVYDYEDDWTLVGNRLTGNDDINDYYFGYAVSMSNDGNVIAVGSKHYLGNTGRAKIFEIVDSAWVQIGDDLVGETSSSNFGVALSVSGDGNRVAVGAYYESNGNGAAYVYDIE